MDKLIEKFLYKALGGRDIDKITEIDDLVKICVRKAYVDMLTGGRYVYAGLSETQLFEVQNVFKNHNYTFTRDMIDEVAQIICFEEILYGKNCRYATRYGLAQKIVNMTYKYFYIFNEFVHIEKLNGIYSECDCPLDSIVLKELGYSNIAWTKITKGEYKEIQDIIANKVGPNPIGNLYFDFKYW